MMKSIYGKLICGFLITIAFSFSVAGYVALRNNYDQIEDMAKSELSATSEYVVGILNSLDDANINDIMNKYAISSEVYITLYSPELDYYTYGENKGYFPSRETMIQYYHDENKNGRFDERKSVQTYGSKAKINGSDVYIFIQKDTSYEKGIFANSAVLILGCVFLSGNLVFLAIADIIVKPITRLTNATKELSKGNYSVRVNYVGDDEISRLNQGFNQMAQQLAKQEETRQKFISDISHEFQTPLTAIQGFANILKEEDLPKEQRQKYADIILFHSKRLSTLSKNMLQLTLLEREEVELEFTTYSIVEQLSRVISTQENQAILKDIEIQFEKPRKDIMVYGDEQRLEQVWINLISNAIKYTGEGGLITVAVKKASREVEVSIEDTGYGMSKEVVSHIFERFYREEKARSVEGNGLLKERILKDGIVIMPDILKVDSFLNHQIDPTLYRQIAQEFKARFKDTKITKILTIEASGIGIALATAFEFDDAPVVFAKKGTAKTTSTHYYSSKVHSFTKGIDYDAIVSKKYLDKDDNILIIDDFLANGQAVLGLVDIVKQAGANIAGVGIVVEKGFQTGRQLIEEKGYRVESLAVVEAFRDGAVILK